MSNQIVITNRNSTATSLIIDGVATPITGSGSISVDQGQLIRVLADPLGAPRFAASGDLSHSAPPPSGGPNVVGPSYSVAVDLATGATTSIVPAMPGRAFVLRSWRISFTGGAGATVAIQEGASLVSGVDINHLTSPATFPSFSWATQPGSGLDIVTGAGAAGTATIDLWGSGF